MSVSLIRSKKNTFDDVLKHGMVRRMEIVVVFGARHALRIHEMLQINFLVPNLNSYRGSLIKPGVS